MTKAPKPDAYYSALGRLAFAASNLEECMVVFTAAFTETKKPSELDAELRSDSWANNTKRLRKLIKLRVGKFHQARLLLLLDESDRVRKLRNDNVHALWQVMVNAETGEFAHVLRARVVIDKKSKSTSLKIGTPELAELNTLAKEISVCAKDLQSNLRHVWDMDEKVREWRLKQGY